MWHIPDKGYVTPRLQDANRVPAIGFTVGRLPGSTADDEDDHGRA